MSGADHFVHFFAGDVSLTTAVTTFIKQGLQAGDVCVVIATLLHRHTIEENLRDVGLIPDALTTSYDYIPVDANVMLSEFFHEGRVDRQKFYQRASLLLRQAAARGRPVRIFGEIPSLLAEQLEDDSAIEVEEMCNALSQHHEFHMFCAYQLDALGSGPERAFFRERIQAVHGRESALWL